MASFYHESLPMKRGIRRPDSSDRHAPHRCLSERTQAVYHQGNADSIAESDFTRIFIHSFVITFLK